MRIASVAKAFSGAVALRLVQRGELALDDTIGRRRPDLPPAWHGVQSEASAGRVTRRGEALFPHRAHAARYGRAR